MKHLVQTPIAAALLAIPAVASAEKALHDDGHVMMTSKTIIICRAPQSDEQGNAMMMAAAHTALACKTRSLGNAFARVG